MTGTEHAHAFMESWSIEQSEVSDMPPEIAALYCNSAEHHAAALVTASAAELLQMPEPAEASAIAIAA